MGKDGAELPAGEVGRLAVRGPTGCRYFGGEGQTGYTSGRGWNLTGDAFRRDERGRFHFAARVAEIIVSDGHRIAGPEVESAPLVHPDVAECAVVGAPDERGGRIVAAHVVPHEGVAPGDDLANGSRPTSGRPSRPAPRSVRFADTLPETPTGKIQRFRLKDA